MIDQANKSRNPLRLTVATSFKGVCASTAESGGGEAQARPASTKAVPGFSDYRARVQRIFETHRKPVMPSPKLLRDCFANELPPKAVYQLVLEIVKGR